MKKKMVGALGLALTALSAGVSGGDGFFAYGEYGAGKQMGACDAADAIIAATVTDTWSGERKCDARDNSGVVGVGFQPNRYFQVRLSAGDLGIASSDVVYAEPTQGTLDASAAVTDMEFKALELVGFIAINDAASFSVGIGRAQVEGAGVASFQVRDTLGAIIDAEQKSYRVDYEVDLYSFGIVWHSTKNVDLYVKQTVYQELSIIENGGDARYTNFGLSYSF